MKVQGLSWELGYEHYFCIMLYKEQMIDPLSNQYQILWSYVRFRILNGRKYGNTNVADYNLLNNKMSHDVTVLWT